MGSQKTLNNQVTTRKEEKSLHNCNENTEQQYAEKIKQTKSQFSIIHKNLKLNNILKLKQNENENE